MKWTIAALVSAACGFGWLVPIENLYDAMQPMVVSASIMVAAIFVRLNRGMPTLDWKGIEPDQRHKLTNQILNVNKEYLAVISIHAALLISLIVLTGVGKATFVGYFPEYIHRICSGYIGAMVVLSMIRMGYIVWRDYDIVRLQKKLIDDAGQKEVREKDKMESSEKVAAMKNADLKMPNVSRPGVWRE